MNIYDEIIKIIQKSPYKLTPQREKIVEILVENDEQHLSAEELYFILKEKTPDIGIATVYRTLDIFYELKILEKICKALDCTPNDVFSFDDDYIG